MATMTVLALVRGAFATGTGASRLGVAMPVEDCVKIWRTNQSPSTKIAGNRNGHRKKTIGTSVVHSRRFRSETFSFSGRSSLPNIVLW